MIKLTEEQSRAVEQPGETPPTLIDPRTNIAYVLVRKDVYERLGGYFYDDSPWTDEERGLLAAELNAMLDDDMTVEDAGS